MMDSYVLFQFRSPHASKMPPMTFIAAENKHTVFHPKKVHNIPPLSAPITRPKAPTAYNPAIMVALADGCSSVHKDKMVTTVNSNDRKSINNAVKAMVTVCPIKINSK